jgi:antibiotic biosynthesis monooxygenase (ABM) superfamily enzyme
MIRFKLQDENNNYKEYSIDIKFDSIEEFDNWVDSSVSFEAREDYMKYGWLFGGR